MEPEYQYPPRKIATPKRRTGPQQSLPEIPYNAQLNSFTGTRPDKGPKYDPSRPSEGFVFSRLNVELRDGPHNAQSTNSIGMQSDERPKYGFPNPSEGSAFSRPNIESKNNSPFKLPGQQSTNDQTSSQPSAGGLFAHLNPNNNNQNQQSNQQSSQQQPASSLFGATQRTQQQQQSQPQPASSLFGGSILNNNASTHGQSQQTGPLQQTNGQGSTNFGESRTSAHFDSLIERGKKRKGGANGAVQLDGLPSLQLSLGDIAGKVRNLGGSREPQPAQGRDGRARDLLAASGVPRAATIRDLNSVGASTSLASSSPSGAADNDIDAYVAQLRAKSTQDLIDDSLEQTKRDFNIFLEENIQMNWQEQRQRIHEHFGIARPSDSSEDGEGAADGRGAFGRSSRLGFDDTFKASSMSRSVLGGSASRGTMRQSLFSDVAEKSGTTPMPSVADDPFLRGKQEKYASKVNELNASRKQGTVYPVIEEFARVEIDAGSDSTQHLTDAYRALKEIAGENSDVRDPSEPGAIRERQYAKDYLDDSASPAKSIALKRQIIDGSRRFLEDQSFQQVEAAVARSPQEANLGGIPSKINKIRAYLRIRAVRKDLGGENAELTMVGDDYCWALIFQLLRCGLVNEATQYVAQNERAIKSMDRNFPMYMAAYSRDADRRLPRDMQTKINSEYSQRTRLAPDNSIDPYRMACYKIVGRCDLSHKNIEGIQMAMEDWLWLLFSLAREVNRVEEAAGEYFGLDDARQVIEQIGQRHFAAGGENTNSYATYFLMQIMAGLFEKAVAYLYPHNYVAAVHFAIALDFYGLLRVSDFNVSESELLTYSTRSQPQISFGRLIGYYTRDFRLARPQAAADYLVLICLDSDLPGAGGESQADICLQALKELVLETREFALLLGDVQINGQRVRGAIEERLPLIVIKDEKDFLRTLTIQAAAVADDAGRKADAVMLYHLAEDYDTVVAVLNRTLSDYITQDLGTDPLSSNQTNSPQQRNNNQPQQHLDPSSTLSLATADTPPTLARSLLTLYQSNALLWQRIRQPNRDCLLKLLSLCEARVAVLRTDTGLVLDHILEAQLLPMRAESNITLIRHAAQNFNMVPQVLARCIGVVLVWSIAALGEERRKMAESPFAANKAQGESMVQVARDVMVFAGLVRYKLPADVFEMLARAGQNVGL